MLKLESPAEDIFVVRDLFTPGECADLIARGEDMGFAAATVRTHRGALLLTQIRNNDRVDFEAPDLAETLWLRVEPVLPNLDGRQAVGVDQHLRFYRYQPGQEFKRHIDGVVQNEQGQSSKLSYLVYLNADFTGGETVFREYTGGEDEGTPRKKTEVVIVPETGMALLFRHEKWHQGNRIEAGSKYVLRTDVFYA